MELKAWYENIGGDYEDIIKRLKTDERILKFLSMFPQDTSFKKLESAWDDIDWSEAFRQAHSLKGLSKTLGLKDLGDNASLLTDSLRSGYQESISDTYFIATKESYKRIIDSLSMIGISL